MDSIEEGWLEFKRLQVDRQQLHEQTVEFLKVCFYSGAGWATALIQGPDERTLVHAEIAKWMKQKDIGRQH